MSKAELSLVKNINYSLIWESMLTYGETTIIALSNRLGLSFPTVSRAVEYGIERGLIIAGAQQESQVGRKACKYRINPDYCHSMMIITDSGILRGVVLDMLGKEVHLCEKKFEYASFNHDILDFINEQTVEDKAIKAVGIALECVVSDGVIVDWIKNPNFVGYDLGDYLFQKLGFIVIIDNNMKALALGATKSVKNKDNLTIATLQSGYSGFGASILVEGEVLRGASNFAGEIGYLPKNANIALEKSKFVSFAQTLIAIVNPHIIFVYDKYNEMNMELLTAQLNKAIPKYAMPEIITSDRFFNDCASGIYTLVKREIFKATLQN